MNLTKGFQNIFTPSLTNLLIALSLVIIIVLVYIKNKTIDLFSDNTDNTDNTDYLQLIIDKYQTKKQQTNQFAQSLALQEQRIQDLQTQANKFLSY